MNGRGKEECGRITSKEEAKKIKCTGRRRKTVC
jgi:hypothetical protein